MRKYYTRACNFYHGKVAKNLIKSKKAFPLNGKKNIAFDHIEILSRDTKRINLNFFHINKINRLDNKIKKTITKDLEKITTKRNKYRIF